MLYKRGKKKIFDLARCRTLHSITKKSKTSICSGVEVDVDIYSASFLTAAASFFQASGSRFDFVTYWNSWTLLQSRLNFSSEYCCSFGKTTLLRCINSESRPSLPPLEKLPRPACTRLEQLIPNSFEDSSNAFDAAERRCDRRCFLCCTANTSSFRF